MAQNYINTELGHNFKIQFSNP